MLSAFFGHHKCASTWITAVLRDLCRGAGLTVGVAHSADAFAALDVERWAAERRIDLLCYTNAEYALVGRIGNLRAIHVIRDPRDICVSAYFSHRYSHPAAVEWPGLAAVRDRLCSLTLAEGLHFEIVFLEHVFTAMATWRYDDPRIVELRYEDVTVAPARFLALAASQLGIDCALAPGDVDRLARRHCFERYSGGRAPGEEDPTSHYRRGTPGAWRDLFDATHHRLFEARYPRLLAVLGYA